MKERMKVKEIKERMREKKMKKREKEMKNDLDSLVRFH